MYQCCARHHKGYKKKKKNTHLKYLVSIFETLKGDIYLSHLKQVLNNNQILEYVRLVFQGVSRTIGIIGRIFSVGGGGEKGPPLKVIGLVDEGGSC